MGVQLVVPEVVHGKLLAHLLRPDAVTEEAAFIFARHEAIGRDHVLSAVDWSPLDENAFAARSGHYLELTDAKRGSLIKRAHDLGTCLVEFHAHLGHRPAAFSWSDVAGLADFVPHVRWRLKGRPYAAVVVTKNSFDALAWVTSSPDPDLLEGILVGHNLTRPTNRSLTPWRLRDGR